MAEAYCFDCHRAQVYYEAVWLHAYGKLTISPERFKVTPAPPVQEGLPDDVTRLITAARKAKAAKDAAIALARIGRQGDADYGRAHDEFAAAEREMYAALAALATQGGA